VNIRLPHADDIVLGTTASPLPIPQFRLSREDQAYHATVWGITGSGKSRLLQSVFLQHLNKKHGVALLEPHHDLSYETLVYLIGRHFFDDDAAFDRLVYLDWGNGAYAPFNILADDGRTDDHTRALNALEGMLRVWPELTDVPLQGVRPPNRSNLRLVRQVGKGPGQSGRVLDKKGFLALVQPICSEHPGATR